MRPRAFAAPPRRLRPPSARRSLVTLAIETSCDDTAVAVLERTPTRTRLLFNERISSDLRAYRGVRPAMALEGHQRTLAGLVRDGIAHLPPPPPYDDGRGGRCPDFVSVTRGPGIHANLATGLFTAKGLAVAWGVPLVGVHHMQAHALTPRLVRALGEPMAGEEEKTAAAATAAAAAGVPPPLRRENPAFPFLTLLVSGGHSQLVLSSSLTSHRVLATTADAALGNVLDQTARVILPEAVLAASPDVMYGRHLETFAFADPSASAAPYAFYTPPRTRAEEIADTDTGYPWRVPLPMRATRRLAYSFSAIHSTVHAIAASRRAGEMDDAERRALARHTQRAAFQHLASRLCLALEDDEGGARAATTLVVAGGVACNKFLMYVLRTTLEARGFLSSSSDGGSSSSSGGGIREIVAPPVALCTDNAAMIAWAGMEMYDAGWHSDLDVVPVPKWPLDPSVRLPDKHGGGPGGLMEIGGWLRWK